MMEAYPLPSEQGMSPKKAHEVSRMSTYVARLAKTVPGSANRVHIVDIGAGQGYLTRALRTHLPSARILALDADTAQTAGAQRWEERLLPKTHLPIDHKVVFISPDSLLAAVDDWVLETSGGDCNATEGSVPVIFVGLHACGSLTPDILRAFTKTVSTSSRRNWQPAGLVVVGCCYNLMVPTDYPPSLKHLPASAYQLAAQVPSEWIKCKSLPEKYNLEPAAALSIRKVVYRALLETVLDRSKAAPISNVKVTDTKSATVPARWSRHNTTVHSGTKQANGPAEVETPHRLGRLRDSAYTSWNNFLREAEKRLKVTFDNDVFDTELEGDIEHGRIASDTVLYNSLSSLHVLRCLLGPLIETHILRYRLDWLVLQLAGISSTNSNQTWALELHSKLVNLFDQSTGSGRNVAIVIASGSFDFFKTA
ncbi:hypothetical protein CPC08DRAFT_707462 [Agrocybe pediades]|nr:hypothetical protein CPC08DRAFT_707462 [Agrocybe pediades]